MPKGRSWTSEEEQFITENRGKKSLSKISSQLKRTPNAVEVHWREMKKRGRCRGSLRHRERVLVWCEECSAFRTKVTKQGCRVCVAKEVLQDKRNEEALLFAKLPQESKDRKKPQTHGSYRSRRPKALDTQGMDAYSKRKADDAHDMALEHWELENIRREVKALQKRIERYRKELE